METVVQLLEGPFGASVMAGSGILTILVVGLWWPILAFREKWWLGVLTFVFAPTFLVFAFINFQKAKLPLILGIILLLMTLGIFVSRAFLATFFVAPA